MRILTVCGVLYTKKKFKLDFIPFYNLIIFEEKNGYENIIELSNNDYTSTQIYYNTTSKEFDIYIRTSWRYPVTDETVDDILETIDRFQWFRKDTTDIQSLKDLMKKNSLK